MPWRKLKGFSRLHIHPEMDPGLGLLYSNRLIIQFGSGLLGLFFPIFLYEQFGNSTDMLLLYYGIAFVMSFLLMAPGAMVMTKIGLKASMVVAIVSLSLWYLAFAFFDVGNALYIIVVALILHNTWRMFYWTPFHSEFAQLTHRKNRGRTMAFLGNIAAVISIVVPVIAGYVLSKFGYDALFIAASAIVVAAVIPLILSRNIVEEYSFGYWETFKQFFHKDHRKMVVAYAADGAEATVGALIWPIFIFQILEGNYFEVGALSTIIILIGMILRLVMGKLTDKKSKHKLLRIGSGLYAAGWIFKMFVDTAFQIFIASTFHNFALIMMRTPFDVLMYERAADAGHYVDEYTVIREMAISLGRVLMIAVLFVLLLFVPLYIAFIFAAIAALLLNSID